MSATQVQKKTGGTSSAATSFNVVYNAAPTPGNLLIACTSGDDDISLSGWTLGPVQNVIAYTAIYYKIAGVSESATVVFSIASSTSGEAIIFEYSGMDASPFDKSASTTSGTTSVPSGTTTTLAQPDELCIAAFGRDGSGLTATYTNSFVSEGAVSGSGGSATTTLAASLIVASTTAVSTTATLSGGSSTANGMIATFKIAPPTSPPPNRLKRWSY